MAPGEHCRELSFVHKLLQRSLCEVHLLKRLFIECLFYEKFYVKIFGEITKWNGVYNLVADHLTYS